MSTVSLKTVRTDADILEVSRLAHETWREHYASILSPDQIEYMLETMQSPGPIKRQIEDGYVYCLVRRLGTSVGYVAYKLNDPAPQMFLSKVYLLASERGHGYFRDILSLLEDAARKANQNSIWLTVNRNNSSAAVYEACGFHTIREQDVDIGGGYAMNDFVMEKNVDAPTD